MESVTAIYDDLNSSAFLRELKCGSLQTLEHLDRTLTPHLIGFLHFVMNIPEADAEEITSDVLLAVSSHVQTFQHGGRAKLTTWIFEIAKNKATDFHRKPRLDALPIDDKFPDHAPAGSDAGRNKHYLCWLNEELAKLAEADRTLLLWRAKGNSIRSNSSMVGNWRRGCSYPAQPVVAQLVSAGEAAFPTEEKL